MIIATLVVMTSSTAGLPDAPRELKAPQIVVETSRGTFRSGEQRRNWSALPSAEGKAWQTLDTRQGLGYLYQLEPRGDGRYLVRVGVHNLGRQPITLERLEFQGRIEANWRGGAVLQFNRRNQGRGFRPLREGLELGGVYATATNKPAFVGAYVETSRHFGHVAVKPVGNTLEIRAWNPGEGIRLDPGVVRWGEPVFLSFRPDPSAELEVAGTLFGERAAWKPWARNFALWCSWYTGIVWPKTLEGKLAKETLEIAEAAKRFQPLGLEVMRPVEDSPWVGREDWPLYSAGVPQGHHKFARQISETGFRPGFWYDNTRVNIGGEVFRNHKDWLARNPDGTPVVVGTGAGYEDHGYLDGTTAGGREMYFHLARKYREAGMTYGFADFTWQSLIGPRNSSDPTKTSVEASRGGMEATRRGFGKEFYWLSQQMHAAVMGLADAMRISIDSWGDKRAAYRDALSLWFFNYRSVHVDPDAWCPMRHSLEWDQAWGSWQVVGGYPITIGGDLRQIPEDRAKLIERLLPPLNQPGQPVDLWERAEPIAVRNVFRRGGETWSVVALSNFRAVPLEADLNLSRVSGITGDQGFLVWDFWNERLLPTAQGRLSVELPSGAGRTLIVRPRKSVPQVLALGEHVGQGAEELESVEWETGSKTLRGLTKGLRGLRDTRVVLFVPEGYGEATVSVDGMPITATRTGELLTFTVSDRLAAKTWLVRFAGSNSVPLDAVSKQSGRTMDVRVPSSFFEAWRRDAAEKWSQWLGSRRAEIPPGYDLTFFARPESVYEEPFEPALGFGIEAGLTGNVTPPVEGYSPKLWYDWQTLTYALPAPPNASSIKVGVTLYDHDSRTRVSDLVLVNRATGEQVVAYRDLPSPSGLDGKKPQTFFIDVPKGWRLDEGLSVEVWRKGGANAVALEFWVVAKS